LSQVGKPEIIGSYALDLMFDEDIDIVVETDNPKKSAKETLNYFIDKETTQKYEFGDFVKFPRENRPQGYIVNLKTVYENAKWEVEIRFFKDTSEYKKQLKIYQDKIDENSREKILEAKYQRRLSGKSKYEKSSFEIYEEILNK